MIFKHWTPRYIKDRIVFWFYEKMNPDTPWLTPESIKIIEDLLKPADVGFEWGVGRSTVWFATRVKHLTSIEHNEEWYETVKNRLKGAGLKNVDLIFKSLEGNKKSTYVRAIDSIEDLSLDFVLIDGRLRSLCTLAAIPKIRSGGLLIIDNINEYIPSDSRSPGSRSYIDGQEDEGWVELIDILKNFRCIWTSNGIFDTAIYFVTSG
jgi:hypothetical protein